MSAWLASWLSFWLCCYYILPPKNEWNEERQIQSKQQLRPIKREQASERERVQLFFVAAVVGEAEFESRIAVCKLLSSSELATQFASESSQVHKQTGWLCLIASCVCLHLLLPSIASRVRHDRSCLHSKSRKSFFFCSQQIKKRKKPYKHRDLSILFCHSWETKKRPGKREKPAQFCSIASSFMKNVD